MRGIIVFDKGITPMHIFGTSNRFIEAYHTVLQPMCKATGLPPMAVDILMFAANNPEHATARNVCKYRGLKPGIVSVHVERLVSEGLLEGDRWHLISVQENLLFSYLEEPRTHVNIRHQPGVPSAELQEWLAVDPESHFEHFAKEQQGPDAPNFVYLPRCAGTHE